MSGKFGSSADGDECVCVCDVETLIGRDTLPTRANSDTTRPSFVGGNPDAPIQYDGYIYIVTTSVILAFIGLFYMHDAFCSSADVGERFPPLM